MFVSLDRIGTHPPPLPQARVPPPPQPKKGGVHTRLGVGWRGGGANSDDRTKSLALCLLCALIKKKIKFSLYIRKFRVEQLQSHIWLTASSYMGKYLRISSYIKKPFLIYDFATAPLWSSLYMRKIWFSFLSVWCVHRIWAKAKEISLNIYKVTMILQYSNSKFIFQVHW